MESYFLVVRPNDTNLLLRKPGECLVEKLQGLVGGYFALISRDDNRGTHQALDCYVNENGLALNLPRNTRAESLLYYLGFPNQWGESGLRGTCVLAAKEKETEDGELDFYPLDEITVAEITAFFKYHLPSSSSTAP